MWENDYCTVLKDVFPCVQAETLDGIPANMTGEVFSKFDRSLGFVCLNKEQVDGICHNYRVRFLCGKLGMFQSAFGFRRNSFLVSLQTFRTLFQRTSLEILGIMCLKLLFCTQYWWIAAVCISLNAWGQTARLLDVWKHSFIWPNNYIFPILLVKFSITSL